jgi:hypothetical protein
MQGRTAYVTDAKSRMQVKEENKKESKGSREIKKAVFDILLEQRVRRVNGKKITTKTKPIMGMKKLLKK